MIRTILGGPVSLSLSLLMHASALAQVPSLTMIGLGAGMSCAEWINDGRDDPSVEQWVFGFASSLASVMQIQRGGDPLGSLDRDRLTQSIAGHCVMRPDDSLATAIARVLLSRG